MYNIENCETLDIGLYLKPIEPFTDMKVGTRGF
jgi:hypothetical protein